MFDKGTAPCRCRLPHPITCAIAPALRHLLWTRFVNIHHPLIFSVPNHDLSFSMLFRTNMHSMLPLRQPKLGSEMLVDSDSYSYSDEKQQDVAIISPDDSMEEPEQEPRADDFDAMRARFMPANPDLEIAAETTNTWDIDSWRTLPRRTHGPTFDCGGHPWRILFFPAGNNASEAVSFYLEQGFADEKPPEDWYACVQFMLVLWNPHDPSIYVHHEANHRFTMEEGDWGFTRFAEKNRIFATRFDDKDRPLVEGDSAKMTAYVRVLKDPTGVLWHNFVKYASSRDIV